MLREKGEFICCFWVASSILPYSKFLFTFFAKKNLHDIDKVVVFYFFKKMNIAKKILSLRINLSPCYINKNVTAFLSSDSSERNFINLIEDEKKKTATVIMQRPPVNSLNTELLQQLTSAIKTLEEKKFRGFILSSNSPTVFSAGLDIMEFVSPKEERLRLFWTSLQTMWKTLYMTPMISIAAINGHAPAGGCLLALSCDESIMVKSRATIGLNETLLGIIAPKWFRQLYINTVSFHYADYALKLGKMFTPEEALKLHLVNELVESPSDLNEKAQSEMDKWLKIPDAARRLTKQSMRKQYVDELISYEKQEVEEIVKFVYLEQTQNALGAYVQSLKGAKK